MSDKVIRGDDQGHTGYRENEADYKEEEEEEKVDDTADDIYPVDRGWAWMVLLAAFMENTLLFGARRSFGVLFKEFMTAYQASATGVALAMTLQTVVISITALIILSVGTRCCSTRVYAMLGGVSGLTAFLLNSFATDVSLLVLSQGVFFGIAHAFCHGTTLVTLGKYFRKKRGLATLLASVGSSVGLLSFPPLVQIFLEEYGLQGTLMILAGIIFNFSVAGALLRPLTFYDRFRKRDTLLSDMRPNDTQTLENSATTCTAKVDLPRGTLDVPKTDRLYRSLENIDLQPQERLRTYTDISSMGEKRQVAVHERHHHHHLAFSSSSAAIYNQSLGIAGSTGDIIGSLCSLPGAPMSAFEDNNPSKGKEHLGGYKGRGTCPSVFSTLKKILLEIFSAKVMCNRLFNMFMAVVCLTIVGVAQIVSFLPAHAEDIGIPKPKVALLLTIMGCADLISKLMLAFLSDLEFIKRHHFVAVANIITGVVVNFIHFFTDFESMLILVLTYGIFGQVYVGFLTVILADFVGVENLSSAMGIVVLLHGTMMSLTSPIIGVIRDVTGSFDIAFHIMGFCMITAGVILFMEPIFRRWEERNRKTVK